MSIGPVASYVPAVVSPAQPHRPQPAPPPPPATSGTDSDGDNDGSKGTLVDVMA